MKHTVAALVENHFGVLARVAGLFSARGFNIDSLTVGETDDPTVSRMTIVAHGDDRIIEQIIKQLSKLIDVIHVEDLTSNEMLDRELVLAKVKAAATARGEIMQIVNTFRAKIVDVNPSNLTIELTGGEGKIDAMLELLRPFGLEEVVRTGAVALSRKTAIKAPPKYSVTTSEVKPKMSVKGAKKSGKKEKVANS